MATVWLTSGWFRLLFGRLRLLVLFWADSANVSADYPFQRASGSERQSLVASRLEFLPIVVLYQILSESAKVSDCGYSEFCMTGDSSFLASISIVFEHSGNSYI